MVPSSVTPTADALLAVDYSQQRHGPIFAVRSILAPVIDRELERLGKN
jgi:hypothetical protein